eukprot:358281-Chlamydomonas_euryale.AAC.5
MPLFRTNLSNVSGRYCRAEPRGRAARFKLGTAAPCQLVGHGRQRREHEGGAPPVALRAMAVLAARCRRRAAAGRNRTLSTNSILASALRLLSGGGDRAHCDYMQSGLTLVVSLWVGGQRCLTARAQGGAGARVATAWIRAHAREARGLEAERGLVAVAADGRRRDRSVRPSVDRTRAVRTYCGRLRNLLLNRAAPAAYAPCRWSSNVHETGSSSPSNFSVLSVLLR